MNSSMLPAPPPNLDVGISDRVAIVEDGDVHLGTAWLCGSAMALTAFHVIRDRAGPFQLSFGNGVRAVGTLFDKDVDVDVALLDLKITNQPAGTWIPLSIDTDGVVVGSQRWQSWGRPKGWPTGYPVDGTVTGFGRDDGIPKMHLLCNQGPMEQLEGISGCPVLDEHGNVIGVVRDSLTKLEDSLLATRMDDAWRRLAKWKSFAPNMKSVGPISRYLERYLQVGDDSAYVDEHASPPQVEVESIFVEPRFRSAYNRAARRGQTSMSLRSLLEHLRSNNVVVLRGEPGSGKTTLLRWLAGKLSGEWLSSQQRSEVPIIIHATNLIGTTLEEHLRSVKSDFNSKLPSGVHWAVLIDGLDEVIDPSDRVEILRHIKRRVTSPAAQGVSMRVILATRPLAILDQEGGLGEHQFVLRPFTAAQLEMFSKRRFAGDPDLAEDFLSNLKSARIEITTPALATIAATVFAKDRRLPRLKADLYDRFIAISMSVRRRVASKRLRDQLGPLDPELAESRASLLQNRQESLLEHLAMGIQLGQIAADGSDLVDAAMGWADRNGLQFARPYHPEDTDRLQAVFRDLLLSSGLLSQAAEGRMTFISNSLREALVARAHARDTPHGTVEEIHRFARTWVHVRWREVVSLVIARWSTDPSNRSALWQVLEPILVGSNRGAHFVGSCVAEGLTLGQEIEQAVYEALLESMDRWNPCGELFAEFKSPNPADAIRALSDRAGFVEIVVDRIRADGSDCPKKADMLLQLAVDVDSIDHVVKLLAGGERTAAAAAIVLGRAGRVDLVLPQLLGMLKDQKADHRRIAIILGEEADEEVAVAVADDASLDVITRLLVLLHIPDARMRYGKKISALVGEIAFDWRRPDHVQLAELLLNLELGPDLRCAPDSTALTFLRAAGETGPLLGSGVHRAARRVMAREPPDSSDALVIANALLLQEPTEEDLEAAKDRFGVYTGDRVESLRLAASLARWGHPQLLLSIVHDPTSENLRYEAAEDLFRAGFIAEARQALLAMATSGDGSWRLADALLDIGETDAAHELFLRAAAADIDVVRSMRSPGYSRVLVAIACDPRADTACRLLAVDTLEHLGDYAALLQVAGQDGAPMLTKWAAATHLGKLGWSKEADDTFRSIASRLGVADADSASLWAAIIRAAIVDKSMSVAELFRQIRWGGNRERTSLLSDLFERDDVQPDQALEIHAATQGIPVEKLTQKVVGRGCGNAVLMRYLSVAHDDATGFVQAMGELEWETLGATDRLDLASELEDMATHIRTRVVASPAALPGDRMRALAKLPDIDASVKSNAYAAIVSSDAAELPQKFEAVVQWLDVDLARASASLLPILDEVIAVGGDVHNVDTLLADALWSFDSENLPPKVVALCKLRLGRDAERHCVDVAIAASRRGQFALALPVLEKIVASADNNLVDRLRASLTLAEHGHAGGIEKLGEIRAELELEGEETLIWSALRSLANRNWRTEAIELASLLLKR